MWNNVNVIDVSFFPAYNALLSITSLPVLQVLSIIFLHYKPIVLIRHNDFGQVYSVVNAMIYSFGLRLSFDPS